MQNNVVADQFNRTKLTGSPLERIQHDLEKQDFNKFEGVARGRTHAKIN